MNVNEQKLEANRREDLRINGFFPFQFRRITVEEYENKKRIWEMYEENEEMGSKEILLPLFSKNKKDVLKSGEVNPYIANILLRIDQKLDMLLNFLVKGADSKELALLEPSEVNISSSGLGFISDSLLSVGDILEVKMIFPTSYFNIIKAFVNVTRVEKEAIFNGSLKYLIGATFLHIDEDDREDIVKYVFKKQKESLRKRSSYRDFSPSR